MSGLEVVLVRRWHAVMLPPAAPYHGQQQRMSHEERW